MGHILSWGLPVQNIEPAGCSSQVKECCWGVWMEESWLSTREMEPFPHRAEGAGVGKEEEGTWSLLSISYLLAQTPWSNQYQVSIWPWRFDHELCPQFFWFLGIQVRVCTCTYWMFRKVEGPSRHEGRACELLGGWEWKERQRECGCGMSKREGTCGSYSNCKIPAGSQFQVYVTLKKKVSAYHFPECSLSWL